MRFIPMLILFCSFWGQAGCAQKVGVVVQSPPPTNQFTMKVSQYHDHVTFHYPTMVGGWKQVCLTVWSRKDDRSNPGDYIEWQDLSCWVPHFITEDRRIPTVAMFVQAQLWVGYDPVDHPTFITRKMAVRPIEGVDGIAGEPIGGFK